jgi:DivIVA domain-containing protein
VLVVEIVLAAIVVLAVAVISVGYGGSMTEASPDWPGHPLPPDRAVRAADVQRARFSLAVRGYRMSEVDDALDRLAHEIALRDARLEQLTGRPFEADDAALLPAPAASSDPANDAVAEPAPETASETASETAVLDRPLRDDIDMSAASPWAAPAVERPPAPESPLYEQLVHEDHLAHDDHDAERP